MNLKNKELIEEYLMLVLKETREIKKYCLFNLDSKYEYSYLQGYFDSIKHIIKGVCSTLDLVKDNIE